MEGMRFSLWDILRLIWQTMMDYPPVRYAVFAALAGALIHNLAALSAHYLIIDSEMSLLWLMALTRSFMLCVLGFLLLHTWYGS